MSKNILAGATPIAWEWPDGSRAVLHGINPHEWIAIRADGSRMDYLGLNLSWPTAEGAEQALAAIGQGPASVPVVACDDGEAVTVEWLYSIGFKDDDKAEVGVDYVWINSGFRCFFDIQRWHDNAWYICDGEGEIQLPTPANKGDVRKLCAALGVPLKEGA